MRFVFCFIVSCIITNAFSQPTLNWNIEYIIPQTVIQVKCAINDSSSNILVGGTILDSNGTGRDPLVVKYDNSGTLAFAWRNQDSTVIESMEEIAVDSLDNIFILTYCYTVQGTFHTLVKLDGNTGAELFRMNYSSGYPEAKFALHDNIIYFFRTSPEDTLHIMDLQGNIISSVPLPYMRRIHSILFSDNYINVSADTVVNVNFQLKFFRFNYSGYLESQYLTNYLNISYDDSYCLNNDNIFFCGYVSTNSTVFINLDYNNNFTDTLLSQVSATCISADNTGNVYFAFQKGSDVFVTKRYPSIHSIMSNDSASAVNKIDLNLDNSGNFYLFTSERWTNGFDVNYQIQSFDNNGNSNWAFDYSNDSLSQDQVFKLLTIGSSIYGVGIIRYNLNPTRSINIFRLSHNTLLEDNVNSEKFILYPNPVANRLIKLNNSITGVFTVYELSGAKIFSRYVEQTYEVLLPANISPGAYLLNITNEGTSYTSKLIVQ